MPLLLISLLGATFSVAAAGSGGGGAVLVTGGLRLTISPGGYVVAVGSGGISLLPQGNHTPFMAFVALGPDDAVSGLTPPPVSALGLQISAVSQPGGPNAAITAEFTTSADIAAITVVVAVRLQGNEHAGSAPGGLLVLEVASVAAASSTGLMPGAMPPLVSLEFVRLGVDVQGRAEFLVAAYDEGSVAVALVPVDLPVDATAAGQQAHGGTELRAGLPLTAADGTVQPLFPAEGSRVALWGGPRSELGTAVAAIEVGFGLPRPTIGGVPAKQSPVVHEGYFLIDMDEASLDDVIGYAIASGMPCITVLWESWTSSCGHCEAPSTNDSF